VQPETLRWKVFEPVLLLGKQRFSNVDIRIRVKGGGQVSQIYAIRQAIAKGIVAFYQKCACVEGCGCGAGGGSGLLSEGAGGGGGGVQRGGSGGQNICQRILAEQQQRGVTCTPIPRRRCG
jgi:hypothetical protein